MARMEQERGRIGLLTFLLHLEVGIFKSLSKCTGQTSRWVVWGTGSSDRYIRFTLKVDLRVRRRGVKEGANLH